MTSKSIKQAIKLCNAIAGVSIDKLKKCSTVQEMEELRDAAESLVDHIDDAIVKSSPCKYNVITVEESIDGFRHYKFKKFSGLCNYRLAPILENQVSEAIRAEDGMLAIRMLIPILDFFNEWSDRLDDSCGEAGVFINEWDSQLDKAISLLPDKVDNKDHEYIEEIMESMEKLDAYGWGGYVKESATKLQEILDGTKKSTKKARRC